MEVDLEQSLEYAIVAFKECEQIEYSKGTSQSSFLVANALYALGSYQKALEYLLLSEQEKYSKETPLVNAEICRVKGRIYNALGLKCSSLKEFKEALEHIEKIENNETRHYAKSMAYENLSVAYNLLALPDSVFFYLQKDKELLENLDESVFFRNRINLYVLLGEYYLEQTKYDSASWFLNQSLVIAEKYNFPYVSTTYLNLGNLYAKQNKPDSALICYFRAEENLQKTNLKSEFLPVYMEIAAVYEKIGMPNKAKEYKEKEILLDNELAKERLMATENALDILLKAETTKVSDKHKREIYSFTGVFFLLLLTVSGYYFSLLKKKQEQLSGKEAETGELKQKVNESFDEVLAMAKRNDPAFPIRFKEVYPEFSRRLLQKHPDLINSEFSFCAMIFLNLSSKEIAQYTYVEHRSVQTRKYRLRKKIGVSAGTDLHEYFIAILENTEE